MDGLPIFYISKRVGRGGKVFLMYKFRSMLELKDKKKISDSKRLNKLGIFLRRTSLDELPQLFNVLKGDMSLVGPRALPVDIEKIPHRFKILRRSILPGITGLSQINYLGKRILRQKLN